MPARSIVIAGMLLLSTIGAAASETVPVTFRLIVEEGPGVADGTLLVLTSGERGEKAVAIDKGDATLLVEPGPWNWRVDDPRISSSPHPVLISRDTRFLELQVQRLAPVTLRLSDPAAAAARVVLAGGDRSESVCRLGDGVLTCMVPIGSRPLQLRVSGWKPLELGRRTIPAEGANLGTIELPGRSSLSGSVEGSVVRLRLLRETATRRSVARDVPEVVPDSAGDFRFEQLPAGTYWIDAESESGSRSQWGPFELDGEPLVLREPLILAPAGRLELQVIPPVDPLGAPWQVSLVPMDDEVHALADEIELPAPDEIGRVESGPLSPGKYIIRLVFEENGATFGRRVIEVQPEQTVIEQMLLEPVRLRGEVKIDDRPASGGMLELRPLEAEVNLSAAGTFETYLPHEGLYTFDLVTEGRPVVRRHRIDSDGSEARVEIDATAVEVRGRVIGPDGEDAAAVVTAAWGEEISTVHTEEDGRFAFAVPRSIGRVELRAITPHGSDSRAGVPAASPAIALRVGRSPILERHLGLTPLQEMIVTVPAEFQRAWIFYGRRDYWRTAYLTSDEATLRFPADLERLTICVLSHRDAGLQCTDHRASEGRVSLAIERKWGELVLEAHGALVPSEIPPYRLYWNDTQIPARLLESWPERLGVENPLAGRVIIPRIATGDVRVCGLLLTEDGVEEMKCVDGTIGGERTVLEIPFE